MTKRFPVAGTDLTIPWEVAEQVALKKLADCGWEPISKFAVSAFTQEQIVTEDSLDTWYGKHWREVAE